MNASSMRACVHMYRTFNYIPKHTEIDITYGRSEVSLPMGGTLIVDINTPTYHSYQLEINMNYG